MNHLTTHNEQRTTNYQLNTSDERSIFMQNKPNFLDAQMNVKSIHTVVYENKSNWTLGENKPNSNPIKPNLPEGKIDAKSVVTKDYGEKCG